MAKGPGSAGEHQDGFTLLELMVAVAIMAVLAGIAWNAYHEYVNKARLLAAEENIVQALHRYGLDRNYSPGTGKLDELVKAGYLKALPVDPWTAKPDWYYSNDGETLTLYANSHPSLKRTLTSYGLPLGSAAAGGGGGVDLTKISGADILGLTPEQIAKLSPEQIAMMSAADFARLSAEQLAALTPEQLAERKMAEKIRAMKQEQFPSIPSKYIKYLTPEQIAGISHGYWMFEFMRKHAQDLSKQQLLGALAINPKLLAPNVWLLSKSQLSWVPKQYFSTIKGGWPIATLLDKRPDLLSQMSPSQLSSISHPYWVGKVVSGYGTQLTKAQLQALDPKGVGPAAGTLPASKLAWLTPEQRAAISGPAVVSVLQKKPSWVSSMTPAQIASINHGWWYSQIPVDVLHAMGKEQIAAIPSAYCAGLKSKLTPEQQAWCQ